MWYIYTMEYYTAIKRDKSGSFVEVWNGPRVCHTDEVSQKEKNEYCILMHACRI